MTTTPVPTIPTTTIPTTTIPTTTTPTATTLSLRSGHLGRLGRIAVATGIVTASFAIGAAASAESPDAAGKGLPSAGIPVPTIPVQPIGRPSRPGKFDVPSIPRPSVPLPSVPLPCFSPRCDRPTLRLPDYATSFDAISSTNGYYRGAPAVPYYVTIRNIGAVNPGAVWSTFASADGQILGIEPVGAWRTDIVAAPAAATARWSAPLAVSYLDDAWIVTDTDGIPPGTGYADVVYLRVWMAGWDRPELIVSANEHVGVDYLGALSPVRYQHAEVTRTNNKISFRL